MVSKDSLCDLCVLCGYLYLVAAEGRDMVYCMKIAVDLPDDLPIAKPGTV